MLPRLTALSAALVLGAAMAAPTASAAPILLTHQTTAIADVNNDGVVAPGDDLAILETVHNGGASTLTGLSATLTSSTPGVTVTQGTVSYPDIAAGADGVSVVPLRVAVASSLPCGTPLSFTLAFTSAAGTASVPFTVATGYTGGFVDYAGSPAIIGDSTPTLRLLSSGLTANGTTNVSDAGIVKAVQVTVGDLVYADIGALGIDLVAPDGTRANLIDHRGAPGDGFTGTQIVPGDPDSLAGAVSPFTGTFHPDGDLSALIGTSQHGVWRLAIGSVGAGTGPAGRLNSWTLRVATADCTPLSYARLDLSATRVDPGDPVDLDASGSFSVNGPITGYEWDLGTGTFGAPTAGATRTDSFPRGRYTLRVRASDAGAPVGIATQILVVSLAPVADIQLPGTPVKQGQTAALDGSASTDPEGAPIAQYDWDVDGDGEFDDAVGAQPDVLFAVAGAQTIGLRVTDVDGATATTSAGLFVTPTTPPVAAIAGTPNPVVAGDRVAFDASGSTDPDGTVVGYAWDLDGNGSFETSTGASPFATSAYPHATALSVRVRVTDNDGRTGVAALPLTVRAAPGGAAVDPGTGGRTGGGSGGAAGPGGAGGAGEPDGSAGGATTLGASLAGVPIQGLKVVRTKGLGLRCVADRAATCTITATLAPDIARRLGLSKSRKRAYVLGRGSAKLTKAGAATVAVRLSRKAVGRLGHTRQVRVIVSGQAVDATGAKVTLRRAILLRR